MAGSNVTVAPTIGEWSAAVFYATSKKWVCGRLSVTAQLVNFVPCGNCLDKPVQIVLDHVTDIRKATTGLFFGAIVVTDRSKSETWISSLDDRESTYRMIVHFWKACLFSKETDSKTSRGPQVQTKMGQKLLSIVHDSQETLSKAAVQLNSQGGQIANMMDIMSDIHNDLDISERLVEDVDSWLGRWQIPKQVENINPVFVNKSDVPQVFEYEILFTKLEMNKANMKQVGSMRLSPDGVTILTNKNTNEYHFTWPNISKIEVVTPWEIKVIRHQIGKADLVYSAVSANMVAILKVLDSCARYKLKYCSLPEHVRKANERIASSHSFLISKQTSSGTSNPGSSTIAHKFQPDSASQSQTRTIQMNQSELLSLKISHPQKVVSDNEAEEISSALKNMKSLALAIQEEQTSQNAKLDSILSDVDVANQRLKNTSGKIEKLA
ncbi:synaptosomal-associated protein 47-like isoform X1 [Dreissena polymorpha]|uniref:Synaptosomal-associated protein 47 n=1 Tax=Dreissena polymorpha TaxID=45954 RepID=A0A9D4HF27_DREPO|nr:synaptosomal-associated protein 47-like isoform X1 [Dreissena polymorpha]XP_052247547.1 synaptosomal-associated protein 47-like isoform X1 [Dreissena polymorpha]KAH3715398.1 hypothetical protein DPMN_058106 [Dreissena polymorpha]